MKQKRLVALLLVVAMLFAFVSVIAACDKHECKHVCETCGKCTDETCTDPACKDKCAGHEAPHVCGHVCETCGKCLDATCTDPVCADKCAGHQHVCKHVCEFCGKCTDASCTDPACADKCAGHDIDPDKGKTKDNPLTPEEAIILMKKAGSGVVVGAAEKQQYYVQGVVNAGSTVNAQYHEWSFTLGTGTDKATCQATIDSSVTKKPEETNGALDGATVIIHGFLELFQGAYKIAYLPQSASPTGSKFTPVIVDVIMPVVQPTSVEFEQAGDLHLIPMANNYFSLTAKVLPANAEQAVTWSVSENEAGIAVSDAGRITWGTTEGEAIVTATATGTNVKADIKVVVGFKGDTEDNAMTVDEAIALMNDVGAGKDIGAYSQNINYGFYIKGLVDAGSKYDSSTSTANSFHTFEMSGTTGKLFCTTGHGNVYSDGALDGYFVVIRAQLKLESGVYKAGSTSKKATLNKDTHPTVTSITIEQSVDVEIGIPLQLHATIVPVNGDMTSAQWKSSVETTATVSETGLVSGLVVGTTEVTLTVGEVTSNKCTVNVTPVKPGSISYDWSAKLVGITAAMAEGGSSNITDSEGARHFNVMSYSSRFTSAINRLTEWNPDLTEITALKYSGYCFYDKTSNQVLQAKLPGFAVNFYRDSDSINANYGGKLQITTTHSIKKITFKVIPSKESTVTQFSVNGVEFKLDRPADKVYSGTTTDMFDATVTLTEAASYLEFAASAIAANKFIIAGITLEW